MQLVTTACLNRLIDDAERYMSTEMRIIKTRTTLAIVAGTGLYTLPAGTIGIENITWLGIDTPNSEQITFRGTDYIRPGASARQATRPDFYMVIGNGLRRIQFYPTPSVSIAANDATVDTATGVRNTVIVQCIRIAQTSGTTVRLPQEIFFPVMKYRAMSDAYTREGKGQNLKAADNFKKKFDFWFQEFRQIYNSVPSAIQYGLGDPWRPTPMSDHGLKYKGRLPTTGAWGY